VGVVVVVGEVGMVVVVVSDEVEDDERVVVVWGTVKTSLEPRGLV
jgi:hypothetical protein